MPPTILFTPSQHDVSSLDFTELKALIDDQISTWSNLLQSEASPASDVTNSPLIWNPDKYDVPLLKPAIPRLNNSPASDARALLSLVEENFKEDALDDWEPFSNDGESPKVPPKDKLLIPNPTRRPMSDSQVRTPAAGGSMTPNKAALYNWETEGTRLSTPHDWKPLQPQNEWETDYPNTILDDCLISQGDAARARRKRGRKPELEIPVELIVRRDTIRIAKLLKDRTARFQTDPDKLVPPLPK